jgi:D-arabinose 1-dehydrogenase-like Zn-dependent alcohol dehydrogenase
MSSCVRRSCGSSGPRRCSSLPRWPRPGQAGARVVALASEERKLTVVRDLGADVTVDYSDGDWPRRVRDAVGNVDVVFDGVGGDIGLAAFDLLGPDGRFCPFGMASDGFAPVTLELAQARQITVLTGTAPSPEELRALTRAALTEAAAGRIRPVIGQELDLAQAASAHAAISAADYCLAGSGADAPEPAAAAVASCNTGRFQLQPLVEPQPSQT